MKFVLSILVLCLAQNVYSQGITVPGKCPEINSTTSYDFSKLTGRFFIQRKYNTGPTANFRCAYFLNTKPSKDEFFIQVGGVYGVRGVINPPNPGRITGPNTFTIRNKNRVILDTDYYSYLAYTGCNVVNSTHVEKVSFVLTRRQYPSQDILNLAEGAFAKYNIDLNGTSIVDQDNCIILHNTLF